MRTIARREQPIKPLRPDQAEIDRHPARFKVVACGRRWGKTTLGLWMAYEAMCRGDRVWWVAPTYGLAFHPWRAFKEACESIQETKLEHARYIELPNGGSVMVKTADNPDLLRGVGLDFVVVDEAAFVSRHTWEAVLLPSLADRQGRALLISTPRGRNWFWQAFERGCDPLFPHWQAWRHPTTDNRIIPPQDIEDQRALLPEHLFKQEYEAEFLTNSGEVFRGVRQAATAVGVEGPQAGHRYLMGVDFGRAIDFTALAVLDATAHPPAMVALDRFSEVSWRVQRARIAALARQWKVSAILAEANAMGEPNIEALRSEGLPIAGFTTSARNKPTLIEDLVKAIEDREVALLDNPVLVSELEAYEFSTTRYGHILYSAPPGAHDDTVIALALAWRLVTTPRLALGIAEPE